jgi:hypothetical protein
MPLNQFEFEDFNPIDFLTLASELNSKIFEFNSSSSSIRRTIFSRSYYATFICVREFLSKNTEYISNPYGEHTRMLNFIKFRGPFSEKVNEDIYWDLRNLKKLRHQSDYYLNVPSKGTKEYKDWLFCDTDFAIDLANNIIKQFKNRFFH